MIYRQLEIFLSRIWFSLLPHVVRSCFRKVQPADGHLQLLLHRVLVGASADSGSSGFFPEIESHRMENALRTVGLTLLDLAKNNHFY